MTCGPYAYRGHYELRIVDERGMKTSVVVEGIPWETDPAFTLKPRVSALVDRHTRDFPNNTTVRVVRVGAESAVATFHRAVAGGPWTLVLSAKSTKR